VIKNCYYEIKFNIDDKYKYKKHSWENKQLLEIFPKIKKKIINYNARYRYRNKNWWKRCKLTILS